MPKPQTEAPAVHITKADKEGEFTITFRDTVNNELISLNFDPKNSWLKFDGKQGFVQKRHVELLNELLSGANTEIIEGFDIKDLKNHLRETLKNASPTQDQVDEWAALEKRMQVLLNDPEHKFPGPAFQERAYPSASLRNTKMMFQFNDLEGKLKNFKRDDLNSYIQSKKDAFNKGTMDERQTVISDMEAKVESLELEETDKLYDTQDKMALLEDLPAALLKEWNVDKQEELPENVQKIYKECSDITEENVDKKIGTVQGLMDQSTNKSKSILRKILDKIDVFNIFKKPEPSQDNKVFDEFKKKFNNIVNRNNKSSAEVSATLSDVISNSEPIDDGSTVVYNHIKNTDGTMSYMADNQPTRDPSKGVDGNHEGLVVVCYGKNNIHGEILEALGMVDSGATFTMGQDKKAYILPPGCSEDKKNGILRAINDHFEEKLNTRLQDNPRSGPGHS